MDDNSADYSIGKTRGEIAVRVCSEDGALLIEITGECTPDDLIKTIIALIETANKMQQTQGKADPDCLKTVNDHFTTEKTNKSVDNPTPDFWKMPDVACMRNRQFTDEECRLCPESKTCIFKGVRKRLRQGDDHPSEREGNPIINYMKIVEEELSKTPEGRKYLAFLEKKIESNILINFSSDAFSKAAIPRACLVIVTCTALGGIFAIIINRRVGFNI